MNCTRPIRSILVVLGAIVGVAFVKSAEAAEATVIAAHVDNNNPTTEGFALSTTDVNITDYTVGPVNDSGILAWNIDTTPGANTSRAFYQQPHSAGEITALTDPLNQVIFTATFRVLADNLRSVNGSDAIDVFFGIDNVEWLIQMGLNSADALVITPSGQSNIVLANGFAWHTLELRDLDADDVSDAAGLQRDFDVYVDNVFQFTWGGVNSASLNRFGFGEIFNAADDETNVNLSLVKLKTTPIPIPKPTSVPRN
jgi:hypothetical protein